MLSQRGLRSIPAGRGFPSSFARLAWCSMATPAQVTDPCLDGAPVDVDCTDWIDAELSSRFREAALQPSGLRSSCRVMVILKCTL